MADPAPGTQSVERKTRVFLSYSRKDNAFTRRLADALVAAGYVADFDQSSHDPDNIATGISAEDEWWRRLQEMIAAADAMLIIVTPDGAASRVCDEEISYARTLGKRIIPILRRAVDFANATPRLAALNVKLSFVDDAAFDASLAGLCAALDLDIVWHREGARLMALAVKWDLDGRPEAQLLPAGAIANGDTWAARRPANAPAPGELLLQFLDASRAKAAADRDRLLTNIGRAFVKPAEQALAEGRFDAALRIAAAGMILSEDEAMRLVPERAAGILRAAEPNALLAVWHGGEGGVLSATFSPDGDRVLAISADGTAQLWDPRTMREIAVLRGGEGRARDFAFSPDGKRIGASAISGMQLWSADDGRAVPPSGAGSAAPGPDLGRFVAEDQTTRTGDAVDLHKVVIVLFPRATSKAIRRDGVQCLGGRLRVRDRFGAREIAAPKLPFTEMVFFHGFSPDGERALASVTDMTARIWNPADGREIAVLRGHEHEITDAAFSPDGGLVLTASHDGTARLWDAAEGREVAILRGHQSAVWTCAFSSDGTRIVTASHDGAARLWDAGVRDALAALSPDAQADSPTFSPDGLRVLAALRDGTARVWDVESGREIAAVQGRAPVAFSADGTRIVVRSEDVAARIWDVEGGREIAALKLPSSSIEFSPDRTRIVMADGAAARVWDIATMRELIAFSIPEKLIAHAAFSPDGARVVAAANKDHRIVSAAQGGVAFIWEIAGRREVATLRTDSKIEMAEFNPDGTRVVTAHNDCTVRIWSALEGTEIAVLRGHGHIVQSARYSRDGARIVTACIGDNTVRIWDAKHGREIMALTGYGVGIAAFSPDGTRVVSLGARLWDVSRTEALCGDVAEILAASLGNGRGVRTKAERADLLMQAAPDDLYEALMARLTPAQRENVARRLEMLSRPRHANCYRAPSQRPGYIAP